VFLFAMALLAQYTGVAAILGRFWRVSRSRTVRRPYAHVDPGRERAAGASIFLAGIGLHLNFGVFRSRSTIALHGDLGRAV